MIRTKILNKKNPDLARDNTSDVEGEGFEPPEPFQVQQFSRLPQ